MTTDKRPDKRALACVSLALTETTMNIPLITWCCIVGLVALLAAIRLRRSLISIGSEREEFFVPGDPINTDCDDDCDDDW